MFETLIAAQKARIAELEAEVGTEGVKRIATERHRQMTQEGWSPEHDDKHTQDQLSFAALCYAMPHRLRSHTKTRDLLASLWPWSMKWWKPTPDDRIRELEKAGALIAADLDRHIRGLAANESKCQKCDGEGWYVEGDPRSGEPVQVQCEPCLGTGKIESKPPQAIKADPEPKADFQICGSTQAGIECTRPEGHEGPCSFEEGERS